MENEITRRADRLVRVFSMVAFAIAALVLFGYGSNRLFLTRGASSLPGMSVATASTVALLAIALIGATLGRPRIVSAATATSVALVAVVVIGRVATGTDVVGESAAGSLFGTRLADAGRMAPGTALSLLLVAAGIVFRDRPRLADYLSGAALLMAAVALLGYLYHVTVLYSSPFFATMSLPTAISLTLLALSTLLLEAERGWSRALLSSRMLGGATRRQLSMLVVPVAAGFVLRRAAAAGRIDDGLAFALMAILAVVPLALLVLRDGRRLHARDVDRAEHADAQAALTRDLEQRLAQKTEQLERESEERSRAEAAASRSQRIEAIGQLTGGIAHDFNNLLAAISGNLELMMRKLPDGDPARRYAVNAAAAVGKGAKLAGQLLAFSRSQRLAIQPTEVAPQLLRARDLLASAVGPSIDLIVGYPQEPVWALTDPDQLELAVLNLAVNARDAMPQGGRLHLEGQVRTARLSPEADERSYVSIRVADTGIGMTPDVLAKAIEPFFTTRERGKGTGLGLAQVYGFVRQCDGDLLIESAPGRGTVVEMLLPVTEAPRTIAAVSGDAPVAGRPVDVRRRLLVVDDDDAVRAVVVELLQQRGYEIRDAAGGPAALALLDTFTPDAAVLDFLMPGMNGAEVARQAQRRITNLPIVFVSGYSETVALDGIAGAVVLRKPFQADALQRAVESALSEAAA